MDNLVLEDLKKEAIELVDKFFFIISFLGVKKFHYEQAKQCSIIHCELMISQLKKLNPDYEEKTYWHPIDHYQKMIEEIKKL